MASNIPPIPISAPISDSSGIVSNVWSDYFRKISAYDRTLSPNGALKLPGGLVLQWGATTSVASGSTFAVSFSSKFPTTCLQVVSSPINNSVSLTSTTGQWGNGESSSSGFKIYNRTSTALSFSWIAVGY